MKPNIKSRIKLFFAALIAMLILWAATASASIRRHDTGIGTIPDFGMEDSVSLFWHEDLDSAFNIAVTEYKPILLFFTSPTCFWCERMKSGIFAEKEIETLLAKFTLVELDSIEQKRLADRFRVSNVPTIISLLPDGREKLRIIGFIETIDFKNKLISVLTTDTAASEQRQHQSALSILLERAKTEKLAYNEWTELILALGNTKTHKLVRDHVLNLSPFPADQVVLLLWDFRLAVRLGALEILEEVAGDDFGFDPWEATKSNPENKQALEKWKIWSKNMSKTPPDHLYTVLTSKHILRYLNDLTSSDRQKWVRAMYKLEQAGPGILQPLDDFLQEKEGMPQGVHNRIREVKYAVMISASDKNLDAEMAHRLVFGNLDTRLKELRKLDQLDEYGIDILMEFLNDKSALVRETAIDTLIKAGGREIIPVIENHIAVENDMEVIITILRGLGTLRSKRSMNLLVSYLDNPREDLVIVSLQSIAKLKSRMPEKDIGKAMDDPRWRVRVAALSCASELNLKSLSGKAETLMEDDDAFVRYNAVKTVAQISNKESAEKLENVFLKDDKLKGAVVGAFGRFDIDLPQSFVPALKGKEPEIIFSVLDNLKSCGKRGLPLAAKLSKHQDTDIACSAVRIIGEYGIEQPEYRKILIEHILSGNAPVVLATLQSTRLSKSQRKAFGLSGYCKLGFGMAYSGTDDIENTDFLNNLFRDFGFVNKSGEKNETGDLIKKYKIGGRYSGPGSMEDMILSAKQYLKVQDSELRVASALFLISCGDMNGVDVLYHAIEKLPVSRRFEIAESIRDAENDKFIRLAEKLLHDPSQQVRKEAADSILTNAKRTSWLDTLFDEITRKGTPLKIYEVDWSRLDQFKSEPRSGKMLRNKLHVILDENKDPMIRNFALITLSKCSRRSDSKNMEVWLKSENQWTRRASFFTLSRISRKNFLEKISLCEKDKSEYVRHVIPTVYRRGSFQWLHHYDKTNFYKEHMWVYNDEQPHKIPDSARNALETLTKDTSVKVRFESMMTLLTNFEKVDLNRFVATANLFVDKTEPGKQVGSYLESNYTRLGPEYEILLPFLKYVKPSEEEQKKIEAHFNKSSNQTQIKTYLARKDSLSLLISDNLNKSTINPIKENSNNVKFIFFNDPECKECEEVSELLLDIKEIYPDLIVEKQVLNTNKALQLNRILCRQFKVPEKDQHVAPSIFSSAGYLVKSDITYDRLKELIHMSENSPPLRVRIPQETRDNLHERPVQKTNPAIQGNLAIYVVTIVVIIIIIISLFFLRRRLWK